MPEGHTIHRLARDIGRDLRGEELTVSSPQGRFESSAIQLDGLVLSKTEAYGKHLSLWFDDIGSVLHIHLGLIGKFTRRDSPPPEPVGAVRLRMEGPEHTWDLAGPTICELGPPTIWDQAVGKLGPDPLRRKPNPEHFLQRLAKSKLPIGRVLLDQTVVAGIGNVYRAEILFLLGIDPRREARLLSADERTALWEEICRELKLGVHLNRILTTDPDEIGKPRSRMTDDDRLYVYKRSVCRRCEHDIDQFDLGNRSIWACPVCQPR